MTIVIRHRLSKRPIRTVKADTLAGANLRGANLQWADLSTLDLKGADLTGVKLSGARLAWMSRELIAEILRAAIEREPDAPDVEGRRALLYRLQTTDHRTCWNEFSELLVWQEYPGLLQWAFKLFYPFAQSDPTGRVIIKRFVTRAVRRGSAPLDSKEWRTLAGDERAEDDMAVTSVTVANEMGAWIDGGQRPDWMEDRTCYQIAMEVRCDPHSPTTRARLEDLVRAVSRWHVRAAKRKAKAT